MEDFKLLGYFANPNNFTIDTVATLSHTSQVNKLKLLTNDYCRYK